MWKNYVTHIVPVIATKVFFFSNGSKFLVGMKKNINAKHRHASFRQDEGEFKAKYHLAEDCYYYKKMLISKEFF